MQGPPAAPVGASLAFGAEHSESSARDGHRPPGTETILDGKLMAPEQNLLKDPVHLPVHFCLLFSNKMQTGHLQSHGVLQHTGASLHLQSPPGPPNPQS